MVSVHSLKGYIAIVAVMNNDLIACVTTLSVYIEPNLVPTQIVIAVRQITPAVV